MFVKILLGVLFIGMVFGAIHFRPTRERSILGARAASGPELRLMTWNVGYGTLEKDSRAKTDDLKEIAQVISAKDPDAVALQELTGKDQLNLLLDHLQHRYRGSIRQLGNTDRFEAVLVKDSNASFDHIPIDGKYAIGTTFHISNKNADIILISAHADAYKAEKRRNYIEDLIDWGRNRAQNALVFIAGDFNLEVSTKKESQLFTNNSKNDSESYNYVLKYFRDLGRDAGDTAISGRRIDYVFGPQEAVLVRKTEVLKNTSIGKMDHWPLLVEVIL
jgi:endonuclease/exonuclease/phosphatase family metal-dependent hydrolase